MQLPITVAEWAKNAREVVRIALEEFHGQPVIAVRVWYRDGNDLKPGRSGITIAIRHLPALAEGLGAALARARAAGLIDGR